MIAYLYIHFISLPFIRVTYPGIILSNWSTDTHSPGFARTCIFDLFTRSFTLQGFLVIEPYIYYTPLDGYFFWGGLGEYVGRLVDEGYQRKYEKVCSAKS